MAFNLDSFVVDSNGNSAVPSISSLVSDSDVIQIEFLTKSSDSKNENLVMKNDVFDKKLKELGKRQSLVYIENDIKHLMIEKQKQWQIKYKSEKSECEWLKIIHKKKDNSADVQLENKKKSDENAQNLTEFVRFNISRRLLCAICDIGWSYATPVQLECIPLILSANDVLVNAITGSGKTGAFLIPTIERLTIALSAAQALIVVPTRELALQCLSICQQLCKYIRKLKSILICGGFDVRPQENELLMHPSIIICTPGRMIDLYRNSILGLSLIEVRILILDEADRLLDMGFKPELMEIISYLPNKNLRQTMLFSATMTNTVMELAVKTLKNNSFRRVCVDASLSFTQTLCQQFIKLSKANEKMRFAMLLSLILSDCKSKCIVFCRTKKEAHYLRIMAQIICGSLCNITCGELHANMSQLSRLKSLNDFRAGKIDVLFCTDVASRGLDISLVQTVINLEFPTNIKSYIHRVGRTARIGAFGIRNYGTSITLFSQSRKHLLKRFVQSQSHSSSIKARSLNPAFVHWCNCKIADVSSDVRHILRMETVAREIRMANQTLIKTQNMIKFGDKIMSKPRKSWIMSYTQKKVLRRKSHLEDLHSNMSNNKKGRKHSKYDSFRLRVIKKHKEQHKKRTMHRL